MPVDRMNDTKAALRDNLRNACVALETAADVIDALYKRVESWPTEAERKEVAETPGLLRVMARNYR